MSVVLNVYLTNPARGQVVKIIVENAYYRTRDRGSGSVGSRPEITWRSRRNHSGFSRVVVVVDNVAEPVHERRDDVGPHTRAGCGREPQRSAVVAVEYLNRQLHDPVEHHRNHAEAG